MKPKKISALAAGSLAMLAFAPEATASLIDISGTVRWGDFDGDNSLEIVVSSPETDCGKGAVYVVNSAGDLTTWGRDTSGVLGTAACNDLFGASLATGDFNDDGYDDLAIAAPGANDTGFAASGSVHVLYGSSTGLTEVGDQLWTLDTPDVEGGAQANSYFGDALAVGDFNCDGDDDLAIGVPRQSGGLVNVLNGSSGGITSVGDRQLSGPILTPTGRFGATLAAGNFNGDQSSGIGCADLVVAAPFYGGSMGAIFRYSGGPAGLPPTHLGYNQDSGGVADTAEQGDLFGWHLAAANVDGDAYDDLLVGVPGDACSGGVGMGRHTFFGSATGLTTVNNALSCDTYGCSVLDGGFLGCHAGSSPVYGWSTADVISLGSSTGVVWGGGGNDKLFGDQGNDVLFGGAGADVFQSGPGRDIIIAGAGDDTILIDLDCMVLEGEVVDGGPGTDTIRSHRNQTQLAALGLTMVSIEQFVVVPENPRGVTVCEPTPIDDGPYLQPPVKLSWSGLTTPNSVLNSSDGLLTLQLQNTSANTIVADLEFVLRVRGEELRIEQGPETLAAATSTSVSFDLNDFIPGGVNPSSVNPALLVLPTSASISVRARLSANSAHVGNSFAPTIFGHLDKDGTGGDIAVLYREGALHDTYYHGDLASWRANAAPYTGTATLLGRIEAHGSRGIPGF
ncbi:calcium-binding protein [Nannocystis pusilla]|uniref:FG-GAP repeat protein n=1 Tax=Nannocystis pusilla TaxID=889268 RepID=A0ABS7TJL3_9BACT|nr:calcium-binding protein [Nannocystis pusilla]MBZ5708413.1 hypothetical protein [Nannocystis pusilla]